MDSLRGRTIYRNLLATLLLFVLIALVHITAALLKSLEINFLGLILYAAVTLVFVKREHRQEIRFRKPLRPAYIFLGLLGAIFFVFLSYMILSKWIGLNSVNFMVLMAKNQMLYGVITPENAWQYFPIAALGYSIFSPLTEELFFRGVLLKAFESKFSMLAANTLQALLFSCIHLAYFGMMEFSAALFYTMVPFIFAAGLLYGWIAQKTESVWASAIVHGVVNFLLILTVYMFIIPVVS